MNVLVFSSLYPNNVWPHHGVFVKERMTSFARLAGCQVKVVAPVPYFPPLNVNHRWLFSQVARHEMRNGLEVYHPRYFMTPKVGMSLYGVTMFLSVLPVIKKISTRFAFDIIDSHFVYPDGFAAVLLGRFFRKPVMVSARGSDINLYRDLWPIRGLLRSTLRRADGVIAVCQALKEAMVNLEIPEEKITVIPNGVDVKKFHPHAKEDARKELGLPHERIILSVGGLIPRKGFDFLIRALKILSQDRGEKNLHLIIVGEGSSRGELMKLAASLNVAERVHLVGAIPHQELYLWYSAADLFCLASSREGWPNVVLEALACGTPVVATDVWGTPEIIRSDTVGFLTRRDEGAIAEKISHALRKSWLPGAIIRYAGAHTWERAALSLRRVFESVLAGVKSPVDRLTQPLPQ